MNVSKLNVLMVAVMLVIGTTNCCNLFCKDRTGKFYCCDRSRNEIGDLIHPGRCPLRNGGFSMFMQLRRCINDADCGSVYMKCCYEPCLRINLCKPSVLNEVK
ncbi:UNVERIFIED_CONTAM: hypothetical protein RMT77_015935 [Armadillidium vulgare]